MQRFLKNRLKERPATVLRPNASVLLIMLLACLMMISSSCGTSKSSHTTGPLSGNWQFAPTPPADNSFSGGIQGGFLLQNNGSVTGQVVYSVTLPSSNTVCNAGSATVSGTANGQSVTLTAVAGSQKFTLTGTISSDGSTMTGPYNSTAGTYSTAGGLQACGTAQTGLTWSATSVPPLNGIIQGSFHSTGFGVDTRLNNQDFAVTGNLIQGPNIGASSATVTGTLNFQGYPCLSTASLNGEISGNSVILEIIAPNGLTVGRIGAPPATTSFPGAVSFQSSATGGYVLHGTNGYGVSTKGCAGSITTPGDIGNVCLGLAQSNSCMQAILLSPAALNFPGQPLGMGATTQSLTLTNTNPSGTVLDGLTISPPGNNFGLSEFDGLPNFIETDNCSSTPGSNFSLAPQQSCTITMSFSPQQSCPWLPAVSLGGAAPSQCPPFISLNSVKSPPALSATISVTCPNCSTANDTNQVFAVPISGLGVSAIQPSVPELDFGPEDASLNEVSPLQSVSFTNQSSSAIQILPAAGTSSCGSPGSTVFLPPLRTPGSVPGLQVVTGATALNSPTITYVCDLDTDGKPNFQIVPGSDTCSGTLLSPQQSCSVAIDYAPQPGEAAGGLDYFLQLNTLQCTTSPMTDCEIDSGRFPVELKSGSASPLRLSPGAGLDFGTWPNGRISSSLTITLFNDNTVANPQMITFTSKVLQGDFSETDNCGVSLAPGSQCMMNIIFTPKVIGFDQGTVTLTYNNGFVQVISLRGFGQ